jgi:ribosomal protein S18 acetylase RimI-like enzyme
MSQGVIVREATDHEIAGWDRQVERFPGARVFHLRSWIESIEAFAGAQPLYLICEKAGETVGCIPGFIVRLGPIRLFCSPREGWQTDGMGPVFFPDRVGSGDLVSALIAFLESRHGIHHIEMSAATLDPSVMQQLGFTGQPIFTYRIPLFPGDPAKTLSGVHPRTRTYMRSLSKGNLIVSLDDDAWFIDEHYSQVQSVFARNGNAIPFSKNRLAQLVHHMRPSGRLLTVALRKPDDGRCIGSGVFLIGGNEMHLWTWAHREEFGRLHPIELITWIAMQKAMEAGCTTLDLSGGGHAKTKYGPLPDETNVRWLRSRYRWMSEARRLAVRGYRLQQSARGRAARLIADRRARGKRATKPVDAPSGELVVRRLELSDLNAVANVHLHAFPDSGITALGEHITERYYRWQMENCGHPAIIGVERAGRLAGFCLVAESFGSLTDFLRAHAPAVAWRLLRRPWALWHFRSQIAGALPVMAKRTRSTSRASRAGRPALWIHAIAVDPSQQRLGIGGRLMREAEAFASGQGYHQMLLAVLTNNERAISLYEASGWVRVPDRANWRGRMQKSLDHVDDRPIPTNELGLKA